MIDKPKPEIASASEARKASDKFCGTGVWRDCIV